jgi:hypothetical protein
MSPASETVPTDEHCYSTSNNAPVNFDLADDPETLPGPEIDPEPMVIELLEEELLKLTRLLRHLRSSLWLTFNNPTAIVS